MAKRFATFDCETDPFAEGRVPAPFIWGVYYGDSGEYYKFTDTDKFARFIADQDCIFYAHNGGKFDFHFLAKHVARNQKILMMGSRLVKAKIKKAEIRDSYSLLPFPLSAYKKDDMDYSKLQKSVRDNHMPEIEAYLKNDCVYLWELIDAFFSEHGRHLTAPSAAIKTLQKMEGFKVENPGRYFFTEFQKHYYGGRCECLRPGSYKNRLTYLDINSAYAFAMQHEHPFNTKWEFKHDKNPKIIGPAFYEIEARSFGAFCRRGENGGLIFDWDGEPRIYFTTGWEILAAQETGMGQIIRHIEQKVFSETRTFKKFIDHFWVERTRWPKGTPQNLFAKLMMNSAYGKFAANPQNYDTFVLYDPAIAEYLVENDWQIRGEIGPHLVCSKPMDPDDMRFYNVATGASITGFVRGMLCRAIASVGNPIYCDTDSIIFSGDCSLPLSDELGAWKVEGTFKEGYFAGKKLYAVRNTTKDEKLSHKGAKLTFNEIKKIAQGKTVIYKQEAPTFSWYKEPTFMQREIKRTAT